MHVHVAASNSQPGPLALHFSEFNLQTNPGFGVGEGKGVTVGTTKSQILDNIRDGFAL
jgi:hypothetical protein